MLSSKHLLNKSKVCLSRFQYKDFLKLNKTISKPFLNKKIFKIGNNVFNESERFEFKRSKKTKNKRYFKPAKGISMLSNDIANLEKLMLNYVNTTRPSVGYYLTKQKSFKKKKKIFKLNFILRVLPKKSLKNKLFRILKSMYFSRSGSIRNNGIKSLYGFFVTKEVLLVGDNHLLLQKKQMFGEKGCEALDKIILRYRKI